MRADALDLEQRRVEHGRLVQVGDVLHDQLADHFEVANASMAMSCSMSRMAGSVM
jgi:hypothetical protein